MRYAIILMMYNQTDRQLELTKETYASLLAQDVGDLEICVVNNGSTQPTVDWLNSLNTSDPRVQVYGAHYAKNVSPVAIANRYLAELFTRHEFVLCCPNDVVLRPDTYSQMLKWPRGVVTASMTDDPQFDINAPVDVQAVSECTPMAMLLLRKWVFDALVTKDGYFMDSRFFHYCSDMDFALRISACGIRGIQLNLPYYHFGSASHRLAPQSVGDQQRVQAAIDRDTFVAKYGFKVDDPQYTQAAVDINFRG